MDCHGVRLLTSVFWTLDDLSPRSGIVQEVRAQIWYVPPHVQLFRKSHQNR